MMMGQSFNSDSSKIIQSSGTNEKKVIDTKRSLGKANLSLDHTWAYILYVYVDCPYIMFIYDCKVEFQAPVALECFVPLV